MTNKALAKIFKALGDETRLEIVRMLAGKERCVCAFLSTFAMSQPAISNHLRVLREADVVIDTREGRWIFYRLNPKAFHAIEALCELVLPDRELERIDPLAEPCACPKPKEESA
ncbi:MAG: transcriptional regulator, ArsR family [Firmicutes bacterium]|nr:transcriptional regulator, ArsR family [Bacillota bacterium]